MRLCLARLGSHTPGSLRGINTRSRFLREPDVVPTTQVRSPMASRISSTALAARTISSAPTADRVSCHTGGCGATTTNSLSPKFARARAAAPMFSGFRGRTRTTRKPVRFAFITMDCIRIAIQLAGRKTASPAAIHPAYCFSFAGASWMGFALGWSVGVADRIRVLDLNCLYSEYRMISFMWTDPVEK